MRVLIIVLRALLILNMLRVGRNIEERALRGEFLIYHDTDYAEIN